jgi:preprotein translocase subunit SecB
MADENNQAAQPSINILAQYTKDLSFENPGAPRSLQARDKAPGITINVNVNANPLSEADFDVVLTLNAEAKEHMLPLLFIECPRLLFPFARQIVADVTRNGGFPPLMIDPIDFAQMFTQRMAEEQARSKVQALNS